MRVFAESYTPPMPAEVSLDRLDDMEIDERVAEHAEEITAAAMVDAAELAKLLDHVSGTGDEIDYLLPIVRGVLDALRPRMLPGKKLLSDADYVAAIAAACENALRPIAKSMAEDRRDEIESAYISERRQ